MRRSHKSKLRILAIAGLLPLCSTWALAGAKEDLSIGPSGACGGGGTAFTITNTNSNNSIHATVTQSTSDQSSVTSIDVTLQPKQQQQLGCSAQSSAGNFLVTWQVQSAQYQ